MPKPQLILASSSPRRKQLLARMGVEFTTVVSGIDETPKGDESAPTYCQRMGFEKALAVQAAHSKDWILGSDTCVVLDDQLLGKPDSPAMASAMLGRLSGREHAVITSVCLLGPQHQDQVLVESKVRFATLSEKQIRRYCDTDEPYDKAGAYGIQGLAGVFVEHIEGDYSAIMGLPLCASWQLLRPYRAATDDDA